MRYLIFFALLLLGSACDRCRLDQCQTRYEFNFRLESPDGRDLLFGAQAPYPAADIRLVDRRGQPADFRLVTDFEQPFVALNLSPDEYFYYVRLNDRDSVLLDFLYSVGQDDCCGDFVSAFSVLADQQSVCLECPFGQVYTIVR